MEAQDMALKNLKGRAVWIFPEPNYDIDLIVGVKNIKITEIEELASIAMTAYEADFRAKVRPGDLLIGGANFGYGHPHYPPMRAMRHLGVAGVIADSFSPGYWRGEISMGFPQVHCPGILDLVARFDEIEVDWAAGLVRNLTRDRSLPFAPLADADRHMLESGGLIGYLKEALAADRAAGRLDQQQEKAG